MEQQVGFESLSVSAVLASSRSLTTHDEREGVRGLRATIERAPVGIAHFGVDGRFLLVNERLCAILGYTAEELLTHTFQEITYPADLETCIALTTALANGSIPSYRHEKRVVHNGGSAVWTRVAVSTVHDETGNVAFFIAIIEDISGQLAHEAARHEAEERLRAALDASATGTFRWDYRTNDLTWDANLDRLLGLAPGRSPQSMDGFVAMVHPDDRSRILEAGWLGADESLDIDEEFRIIRPDGSERWLCGKGKTIPGSDGAPRYMTGALTDVTERREAEDALRDSETRFRTLANTIPQLAWLADADGRRSWYNDRWYEFTGLGEGEAMDNGWQRVVHPDYLDRVRSGQLASFKRGDVWEDTYPLRRRDGVYRWFLTRAVPVRETTGQISHWLGTNTDVTERLEAERAVRESEAKLRRIVDSGIVGVFYWTRARDITDANDEFLRMLGYTRDDLASGRLNGRALTPSRWEAIDELKMAELTATGVASQWEKEFNDSTGRPIPVLVAKALLEGASDKGIGICLDISERKAAEMEVESLLAREREARSQAELAMHARDEVLAIVAHDLRNPVHTIGMIAGTLETIPVSEEQRARQMKIIQRSAARMEHLIQDLLDVTRIESGAFAIRHESVDVTRLLHDMLESFEQQSQSRGIVIASDVAVDLPPVVGDRDRLAQALSNLIDNALKFTSAGGCVALRARRVGDGVHVSVEDSGRGVPADSLPHVFDRYWQAEHASRAGAGLGLTIVKGIIEAHGGRIWVESVLGSGTTFHFTVPCAEGTSP